MLEKSMPKGQKTRKKYKKMDHTPKIVDNFGT